MKSLTGVVAGLLLAAVLSGQEPKPADKPQYFDEPSFIAAGVTDSSNRGGHGSDPVLRSTEVLAKATASLSSSASTSLTEQALRDRIAREPTDAALHHSLADVEEKRGDALNALREYQRAAELDASEPYLFDLGDELLTHHAAEQAAEVFVQGARLFPRSSRMLLALAVARYSQGSYDEARERFFAAVDLHPEDPMPYLFLGKVQNSAIGQSDGFTARLARFVTLHPENAWANYYFAVSLWKRSTEDPVAQGRARDLLERAVHLDPHLGVAWLELGVLYADRKEDGKAISAWQRATAADPQMEEAHYRLAQAYRRIGDAAKATREIEVFERLSKESADRIEAERAGVRQFVFDRR